MLLLALLLALLQALLLLPERLTMLLLVAAELVAPSAAELVAPPAAELASAQPLPKEPPAEQSASDEPSAARQVQLQVAREPMHRALARHAFDLPSRAAPSAAPAQMVAPRLAKRPAREMSRPHAAKASPAMSLRAAPPTVLLHAAPRA